jgi:hypothetical protein
MRLICVNGSESSRGSECFVGKTGLVVGRSRHVYVLVMLLSIVVAEGGEAAEDIAEERHDGG